MELVSFCILTVQKSLSQGQCLKALSRDSAFAWLCLYRKVFFLLQKNSVLSNLTFSFFFFVTISVL